ncbi:LysR substrate-binding domain-containing protein [Streptomyces griseofuscus]|uniref:LysR substrate-binding domain-containing protein n=1 Tax=Streptomyces griseofuscus TaxID=146922 RepID=UPI0033DFE43E
MTANAPHGAGSSGSPGQGGGAERFGGAVEARAQGRVRDAGGQVLHGAGHLSLAELREDSFALAGDGPLQQLAQRALLACDRAGFVPTVRAHADNLPGLLSYVASGLCVTLAPEHTAALSFSGVRFLPLTDEAPELTTTIAAPHRRHADPAVRSLPALAGASLAG